MRKILKFSFLLLVLVAFNSLLYYLLTSSTIMEITSTAFIENGNIPSKYTCDGENINPPIKITGVPAEAQTIAIISDDPDAPMGTWIHWTIWNIPASETVEIPENFVPKGTTEGITSFKTQGYGGPCPPKGTHRYFFKVFALDTELELDITEDITDIELAMEGHILDSAQLMGVYNRTSESQ